MLYGLVLVSLSILGMIYAGNKKSKMLMFLSILLLILVIAVWSYFWFNPDISY